MTSYTLLGGRLRLLDHPPRPSEDPLWLASSLPDLPATAHVLDAGCGSGVLALATRVFQPAAARLFTLLDVDDRLTHLAANNATINRLPARLLTSNWLQLPAGQCWDAIISNPPYHRQDQGHHSPTRSRAHSAPPGFLQAWLQAAFQHTTAHGHIHLIVHTQALPLLQPLCAQVAATVQPLQTRAQAPAKRALMHIYKNRPPAWTVHPPLPVWQPALRTQVLQHAQRLPASGVAT